MPCSKATIEKLHPLELVHAEGLATVAKLTEQKANAEAEVAKAGQELERVRCLHLSWLAASFDEPAPLHLPPHTP